MNQHHSASPLENIFFRRIGAFPKSAVLVLFGQGEKTLVYVGNNQHTVDVRLEELLQELGPEKFVPISTARFGSNYHWVRISSVYDVDTTSVSSEEVAIFLYNRIEPLRLHQVPLEHVYEQLGWVPPSNG